MVQTPDRTRRPRIALIADFKEEGWPSMDRFAESIYRELRAMGAEFDVELIRPRMLRLFSRLPFLARQGAAFNTDRLFNRLISYPCKLRKIRKQFDLFHLVDHSYSQLVHVLDPRRVLVTCHDIDTFQCLLHPEQFPAGYGFRWMTRRILDGFQKAARVACVSQATLDAVLKQGLHPANRLDVCHNGVDQLFFNTNHSGDSIHLQLLHVGSTIPRKRIDVLLRVFAAVHKRFPEVRLSRVGGRFTAEQEALAQELGVGQSISTLENISETELAEVLAGATLLLQPSSAEGFGLPVVEAMAAGTPVLSSDLPVLREVGGSAAEYAPVAELGEWMEKVCFLLDEARKKPDKWELRRKRCREQAGKFSWDNTAQTVAGIYREMLQPLNF